MDIVICGFVRIITAQRKSTDQRDEGEREVGRAAAENRDLTCRKHDLRNAVAFVLSHFLSCTDRSVKRRAWPGAPFHSKHLPFSVTVSTYVKVVHGVRLEVATSRC